jgi:hypothetical protein
MGALTDELEIEILADGTIQTTAGRILSFAKTPSGGQSD